MDEPYWLLWIAGPIFVIGGILILFNHQRVYEHIRRRNEKTAFTRATSVDTFGNSWSVILPAVVFIPLGAAATFFGLSRFFGWGYM